MVFSSEWGFSIPDFTANLLGISFFALQQKALGEQKVTLKMSYWPESYPNFSNRANALFGSSFPEQFIKDYNAQTYWLSVNPSLIFPKIKTPKWLNIAIGYGAQNMYGGFENSWVENGSVISVDQNTLPRKKQFILALDYDLRKIKTNSRFLKSILGFLNIFKWPAPGIELTSKGEFKFHAMTRL